MRKLGIYGIISGTLSLLLIISFAVFSYLRGLWNLRKFGAEIYVRDLLFNILTEMWLWILYLFIFSVVSIILGILLVKEKRRALKVWISFYGFIVASCLISMIIMGFPFSLGEFSISSFILFISIRVLKRTDDSNLAVQGTARVGPL